MCWMIVQIYRIISKKSEQMCFLKKAWTKMNHFQQEILMRWQKRSTLADGGKPETYRSQFAVSVFIVIFAQ